MLALNNLPHQQRRRSVLMTLAKKLAGAALLAGAAFTLNAHAHGIWFAQRSTQLALIYGVGADDLDAVKRAPLVKAVAGYDADGKPVPTRLRAAGPLLVVDSEGVANVVTAVMDNGTWSKAPDGEWHKKGKDEMPQAVLSEKTIKYAVVLRGPLSKPLPALPGQTLQIGPVDAALPLLLGQPLKLRVLFNGKPVAGAQVQNDYVNDPDNEGVKSDANGIATISVRNQGLNVVAATLDGLSDEPTKSSKIEHRATLSFVLPHAPE
jgi:nickel transport protein